MLVRPELTPEGDEFVSSEFDPEGEKKINMDGELQGGRQFRMSTFKLPGRGTRLFMMATECAKELNFRDSYLLFNKNKSLYKMIASQKDKEALIALGLLPYSFRSRVIGIITARSIYRQFGARAIVDGRRVVDDYWELRAIDQGFTESDPVIMDRRGQITHVYNQEVYGTPNPPNLPKTQKKQPKSEKSAPQHQALHQLRQPQMSQQGLLSQQPQALSQLQTPAHVHPQVHAQMQQSQQLMGGSGPTVPAAPAILAADSSNQPINNAAAAAAQVETANLKNLLLSTYMPGTSIRGSLDYQQGNVSLAAKYNIASIDFFENYSAPEIEASYSALEYNRYLGSQRKFRKDMWANFWQIKAAGELPSKPNLGVLDANEEFSANQGEMMKRKQESVEQEAVIVNTKKRRGRGLDTPSATSSAPPEDNAEPTFQDVSSELTQSQPPPQIRKLPMAVTRQEYLEQMYANEQRVQAASAAAPETKSPKLFRKPLAPQQHMVGGMVQENMMQVPMDHQINQQRFSGNQMPGGSQIPGGPISMGQMGVPGGPMGQMGQHAPMGGQPMGQPMGQQGMPQLQSQMQAQQQLRHMSPQQGMPITSPVSPMNRMTPQGYQPMGQVPGGMGQAPQGVQGMNGGVWRTNNFM